MADAFSKIPKGDVFQQQSWPNLSMGFFFYKLTSGLIIISNVEFMIYFDVHNIKIPLYLII